MYVRVFAALARLIQRRIASHHAKHLGRVPPPLSSNRFRMVPPFSLPHSLTFMKVFIRKSDGAARALSNLSLLHSAGLDQKLHHLKHTS